MPRILMAPGVCRVTVRTMRPDPSPRPRLTLRRWAVLTLTTAVVSTAVATASIVWALDDGGKTVRTNVFGNPDMTFHGQYPQTPSARTEFVLTPRAEQWTPAQLERAFAVGSAPSPSASDTAETTYIWPDTAQATVQPYPWEGAGATLMFDRYDVPEQPTHARRHEAAADRAEAVTAARRALDELGLRAVAVTPVTGPADATSDIRLQVAPLVGGVPLETSDAVGSVVVRHGVVIRATLRGHDVQEAGSVVPVPARDAFNAVRHSAGTVRNGDAEGVFTSGELTRATYRGDSGAPVRVVPAWVFERADGNVLVISADPELPAKDHWGSSLTLFAPED